MISWLVGTNIIVELVLTPKIAGGVASRTIPGQTDEPDEKSKSEEDQVSKSFVSMLETYNSELTSMEPFMKLKEKKMESIFPDVDLLLEDMTRYKERLESVKNMYKAKVSAVTSIFQVKQEPNPKQF